MKHPNGRTQTTHHSAQTREAANADDQRGAANRHSTFDTLPDSGYLRQAQLIPDVVPFSSATLWRKCKAGQFPAPVRLSQRVTAWSVGSVRAWLNARAQGAAR